MSLDETIAFEEPASCETQPVDPLRQSLLLTETAMSIKIAPSIN